MAHRVHIQASLNGIGHRSPLSQRSAIVRSRGPTVSQVRSLWWWRRHSNEWSSFDEGLEERVRRHQRIMRHRYSKMLRRRSIWEKDIASRFVWPWQMTGSPAGGQMHDAQNISSTKASRAKLGEEDDRGDRDNPLATLHKDFESFKQAVDNAMEKDPYGTLFGRRLRGPLSPNNSSWTSFSWMFDPKEIREDQVETKTASLSASGGAASTPKVAPKSATDEEWRYDPISMRKVPKTTSLNPETPKKGILQTLFSENGVDIPVKIYKPHTVYGYSEQKKDAKQTDLSTQTPPKKDFGSSRKREFQALKALTLGNTMDTTAEFGGKYATEESTLPSNGPAKRSRNLGEPSEDAPLFSGTTYEDKSAEILASRTPKSDWLRAEGFKNEVPIKETQASKKSDDTFDIPVKKFRGEMEPSLDRMATDRASSTVIQPALDRHVGDVRASPRTLQDGLNEKTEDMDLLRPHMVRANTRTARTMRQDIEEQKQETRSKLENDFATRTATSTGNATTPPTSGKIAKSLDNVWKHVQNYPDGIVAKTMRSIGMVNENFKKYDKSYKPATDSLEKLSFEDDSLSSVASIYKSPRKLSKPVTAFTPSKEVLDAERENVARAAALQTASTGAKAASRNEDEKVKHLAREIRRAYEDDYGKIDTKHRQIVRAAIQLARPVSQSRGKLHPLRTAEVKEGVPRYPAIESYVSQFEPTYACLVDEAKQIRREMHEAQLHYRSLRDQMQRSPWYEVEKVAAPQQLTMLKEDPVEEDFPQGLDGPFVPESPWTKKTETAAANASTTSDAKIQEPVFTPSGSSTWNDEQPPPISELKDAYSYTSPYVVLKYNKQIDRVDVVPAERPTTGFMSSAVAFDRLDNAAKFLSHFPSLHKAGYEMLTGGQDFVLFRYSGAAKHSNDKPIEEHPTVPEFAQPVKQVTPTSPPTPIVDEPTEAQKIEAATVLDEIPEPVPGPSAPTTPPTNPTLRQEPPTRRREGPKVKRQEEVFSGTIRPVPAPSPSPSAAPPNAENFDLPSEPKIGAWHRFTRLIRRTILTITAAGVGAYVIGVVAEGLGAQQQRSGDQGPRKKVVMPAGTAHGTRPGIYSTENSR